MRALIRPEQGMTWPTKPLPPESPVSATMGALGFCFLEILFVSRLLLDGSQSKVYKGCTDLVVVHGVVAIAEATLLVLRVHRMGVDILHACD